MKKILMILAVVVAMFASIPAQAQFQWGIRGGVNLAKASISTDVLKSENHTGFFIGPTAELTIPLIGLGVDGSLLFSQTGIATEDNGTMKRLSFEVPINLKYNIGLGNLLGVFIATGPQFGFGLSDDELEIDGQTFSFKSSTVSYNIGVGVKLIGHLQAGVNYNIPLGKTAEIDGVSDAVSGAFSAKLKTWQISVAYMF